VQRLFNVCSKFKTQELAYESKRIFLRRWVELTNEQNATNYREKKENSDDDDEEEDVKPIVKTERLSPSCEQSNSNGEEANNVDETSIKTLFGLHLTFNLEAGSLLPLAIKLVTLEERIHR